LRPRTVLTALLVLATVTTAVAAPEKPPTFAGSWDIHLIRGEKDVPRVCQGALEFQETPRGWVGVIRFRRFLGHKLHRLDDLEVLRDGFTGRLSTRKVSCMLKGTLEKDSLSGSADFGGDDWFKWKACRPGAFFEPGIRSHSNRMRGNAKQLRLLPKPLETLVIEARDAASDALVVMKKGRIVVDRSYGYSREPIPLMELTEFVTGFGVAMLLHEKKIPSLDEPMATWYPEWKDGPRAKITLRHVLTHTSGILPRPADEKSADKPAAKNDGIATALSLEPSKEPGAKWVRNPDLLPLLAGLFPRTVKKPMDAYLAKKLHRTLRIEKWTWERDAAGTPRAGTGLAMASGDLARLGRVIVDEGASAGKTLVAKKWIELFSSPATDRAPDQGLAWRLIRKGDGPVEGLAIRGRLGQWLVVLPESKLVAVRLRRSRDVRDDETDDYDLALFLELLRATLK